MKAVLTRSGFCIVTFVHEEGYAHAFSSQSRDGTVVSPPGREEQETSGNTGPNSDLVPPQRPQHAARWRSRSGLLWLSVRRRGIFKSSFIVNYGVKVLVVAEARFLH